MDILFLISAAVAALTVIYFSPCTKEKARNNAAAGDRRN